MSPIFRRRYFRHSHFVNHLRRFLVMHFISAHFTHLHLFMMCLRFDYQTSPQSYNLISLLSTHCNLLQVSMVEFYVNLDFGQIEELQIVDHVPLNFLWYRFQVICWQWRPFRSTQHLHQPNLSPADIWYCPLQISPFRLKSFALACQFCGANLERLP